MTIILVIIQCCRIYSISQERSEEFKLNVDLTMSSAISDTSVTAGGCITLIWFQFTGGQETLSRLRLYTGVLWQSTVFSSPLAFSAQSIGCFFVSCVFKGHLASLNLDACGGFSEFPG